MLWDDAKLLLASPILDPHTAPSELGLEYIVVELPDQTMQTGIKTNGGIQFFGDPWSPGDLISALTTREAKKLFCDISDFCSALSSRELTYRKDLHLTCDRVFSFFSSSHNPFSRWDIFRMPLGILTHLLFSLPYGEPDDYVIDQRLTHSEVTIIDDCFAAFSAMITDFIARCRTIVKTLDYLSPPHSAHAPKLSVPYISSELYKGANLRHSIDYMYLQVVESDDMVNYRPQDDESIFDRPDDRFPAAANLARQRDYLDYVNALRAFGKTEFYMKLASLGAVSKKALKEAMGDASYLETIAAAYNGQLLEKALLRFFDDTDFDVFDDALTDSVWERAYDHYKAALSQYQSNHATEYAEWRIQKHCQSVKVMYHIVPNPAFLLNIDLQKCLEKDALPVLCPTCKLFFVPTPMRRVFCSDACRSGKERKKLLDEETANDEALKQVKKFYNAMASRGRYDSNRSPLSITAAELKHWRDTVYTPATNEYKAVKARCKYLPPEIADKISEDAKEELLAKTKPHNYSSRPPRKKKAKNKLIPNN